MTKKVQVEDVEYTIVAGPPYLQHLLKRYSQLSKAEAESTDEALQLMEDQKRLMTKILEETVLKPKPEAGHTIHLFDEVSRYTREVIRGFRGLQASHPTIEDGGEPRTAAPPEAK